MIKFVVPGKPVPKGRPRVMRGGWTFTPKKTLIHEKLICLCGISARKASKLSILGGDIHLHVIFYGANPLADIDNLLKTVLDALNGILFNDDRQIVEVHMQKRSCPKGQECTEIGVDELVS